MKQTSQPPPPSLAEIKRQFKPLQATPGPDAPFHAALAHARNQVEAMTGDWAMPVRLRLIDQRHDVPKEQRQGVKQLFGSLADDAFCRELWGLNTREHWEVYVVAQEVREDLPSDAAVKGHHIVSGRVAVADFDGKRPIDPSLYHLDPAFSLVRENDEEYYWLSWSIEPYDAARIPELHRRIIQYYDSDPAVYDAPRLMRLAGFWSHKRPERTRYLFQRGPGWGMHETLYDHLERLPKVKRKPVSEGDWDSKDYVSEERLRFLLKHIDPECKRQRKKWIAYLGAIKDASIRRDDRTFMEPFDKYELADEFSSGALGGFTPTNYESFDDVVNTIETLGSERGERATIGSIVQDAQAAGMDRARHERLRKAEAFTHPDNETKDRVPTEPGTEGKPEVEYPEPLSAAELAAGDFPRAEYAWQDFVLARHVNLLHGDGGTGKTLLVEHIAVATVAGLPLFGRETRQMPALLVLAEDGDGETKARLEAICAKLGVNLPDLPLHAWCLPGFDVNIAHVADDGTWKPGPFMEPLRRKLAKLGPCLLILDTAPDIASLDEIKRPPVNTLCKVILAGLCREFGATVLMTAHPSKAAMADGSGYAGSTAWNNAVRNRLTLEQPGKGSRRVLRVAKVNYGSEAELELFMFGPTFSTATESHQGEREAEEREAVLNVTLGLLDRGIQIMRTSGNGQKPRDVAKEVQEHYNFELTDREVRDHLNALEREGKLGYQNADKNKRGVRTGFYRLER